MEGPLAWRIDFGLGVNRRARRNTYHMLDRVPLAGTVIKDAPHAVQMHGVAHHCLVDEFEPHPFAILQANFLFILIFLAVDGPDLPFHVAGQTQFNFPGCLTVFVQGPLRL